MITPRCSLQNSLRLLVALTLFAFCPLARVQAQLPDQIEKMAAAIPLTTALLDGLDKFVKTVASDAAVRADMDAMDKDPAMSGGMDKFAEVVAKYPKLAGAFKSAGISPDDFVKANGALAATGGAVEIADAGMPTGTDKTVQANIAFFKANKERCTATLNSLQTLGK